MAFESYPGAGTTLTAAKLQALIAEVRPLYVRKTADQTITSSTTLTNDTHLFIPMAANTTYKLSGLLRYTCASVTPDLKIAFTIPTGTTGTAFGAGGGTNVTGQEGSISLYSPTGSAGSIAAIHYGTNNSSGFPVGIALNGTIRTGGTAGNLQLQWAQVTSDANGITMLIDSDLELRKVA